MMNGCLVLLGGARSGKSDLAARLGTDWDGPVVFVATAEASDDDMTRRISRHQTDRPADWATFESPRFNVLEANSLRPDALVIVDCLTMLVSNLMLADEPQSDESQSDDAVVNHVGDLIDVLQQRASPSIVITNEVGMGVHPLTELGRRYRDLLGRVNKRAVELADRSGLVVAGAVLPLSTPSTLAELWA